jgi:hypothetical protein
VDQSANTPRPSRHEPAPPESHPTADPGSEPFLDPAVEAQVRALLANTPDPGAMPASVTARIASALAEENRLRPARGPFADQDPDADVLLPLIRQRQRPRPWLAVAAVAAAAAVVAVGGSALHLSRNVHTNPAAVVSGTTVRAGTPGSTETPTQPIASTVHLQQSGTDYEPASFAGQVRALLAHPGTALTDTQALAPALGPVATSAGLTSCLEALGEFPPYRVTADLGLYQGTPAAIVAVTRDSSTTAYAVGRDCRPGDVKILRDATALP